MLPSLSLTMFMLFFTVVEVTRVRNSRNMVAWSFVGRVLSGFCFLVPVLVLFSLQCYFTPAEHGYLQSMFNVNVY